MSNIRKEENEMLVEDEGGKRMREEENEGLGRTCKQMISEKKKQRRRKKNSKERKENVGRGEKDETEVRQRKKN